MNTIEGDIKHAANLAQRAVDGIMDAGKELKEEAGDAASAAREKARTAGKKIGEIASEVRDRVREKASDLADGVGEVIDDSQEQVRSLMEDGIEFVRQNPVATVVASLALGFLAARVIRD